MMIFDQIRILNNIIQMRKLLVLLFLVLFVYSCPSSKKNYKDLLNDSAEQKRVFSYESGHVEKLEVLQSLILTKSPENLDLSKPVVIIYHPGKDPCNSSGSATRRDRKSFHKDLTEGILELEANPPVYLYKDKEGLEKYDGIIDWHKDPGGIAEKLFFRQHYPCSSFVVISPTGDYLSRFGEFDALAVWRAIDLLPKTSS